MKRSRAAVAFLLPLVLWAAVLSLEASRSGDAKANGRSVSERIWKDPGDVAARNLRYGPGSQARAPVPPFRFIKEDRHGTTPKFVVKDARNVTWSVKLGPEAQTETVATRIIWAVGYFAEETYYFKQARIENLPGLARGQTYVDSPAVVREARFEPRRENIRRGDHWRWDKNPFVGTRELDGLKVLMVLLNNFDTKPKNNRVLILQKGPRRPPERRYVVTDLGATFGCVGGVGEKRTKNNVDDFRSAKFIVGVEDGRVQFDYDKRPGGFGAVTILYPPFYLGEARTEKALRKIPIEHARWVGSLLSQLKDSQLHDAFHVAGYDRATAIAYVEALRHRIKALTSL